MKKRIILLPVLLNLFGLSGYGQIHLILLGDLDVTLDLYSSYTEQGWTAIDTNGVDYSSLVKVDRGSFRTDSVGNYEILYTVTDSSNHTASAHRLVQVVCRIKPLMKFLWGFYPVTYKNYKDSGALLLPHCNNKDTIIVYSSTYPKPEPGSYLLLYDGTDMYGNKAETRTRLIMIIEEPMGIEDVSKESFKIYPNPANDKLFIESLINHPKSTIFNSIGQKVMESSETSINTSHLREGIYFLRVLDNDGMRAFEEKVVIEH